jgi:hypothetical protein
MAATIVSKGANAGAIDLAGWDTAYVVSLDSANASLRTDSGQIPNGLNGRSAANSDLEYQLNGIMGPWQFQSLGAGDSFQLVIPFTGGAVTIGSEKSNLAGAAVGLEVRLQWVPSGVSGGYAAALQYPAPQALGSSSVINNANLGIQAQVLLPACVADTLGQQAGSIGWQLAEVNPAPPGSDTWLTPSSAEFLAAVDASSGRAFLGILGALRGQNVSSLPRSITFGMPSGSAAFAIDGNALLRNPIRRALASSFDLDPNSIWLDSFGNLEWSGSHDFPAVKVGLIHYHPVLDSFSASLSGSSLIVKGDGQCQLSPGIVLPFNIQATYMTLFDCQTAALSFFPAGIPAVTYTSPAGFGDIITTIIEGIIEAVADAIGQSMADSALVTGAVPQMIGAVLWSGMKTPSITSWQMNGSLLVDGTF